MDWVGLSRCQKQRKVISPGQAAESHKQSGSKVWIFAMNVQFFNHQMCSGSIFKSAHPNHVWKATSPHPFSGGSYLLDL